MLGYSLSLGHGAAWEGFTAVILMRLSDAERVSLAYAALRALSDDHIEITAATVLQAAGSPLPTFLEPMSDARWWASMASTKERKAYALAAFEALGDRDRTAFVNHVTNGRAAA